MTTENKPAADLSATVNRMLDLATKETKDTFLAHAVIRTPADGVMGATGRGGEPDDETFNEAMLVTFLEAAEYFAKRLDRTVVMGDIRKVRDRVEGGGR